MCPANPALQAGSLPTGRQEGAQYKMTYLAGKPFDLLRAVSFVERPRPVGGEFDYPMLFMANWPGVFNEFSALPVLFAGFGITTGWPSKET